MRGGPIALDLLGIQPDRVGGMERYAFELARALAAGRPAQPFALMVRPDTAAALGDLEGRPNCALIREQLPGWLKRTPILGTLAEWDWCSRQLASRGVRLLHAVYALLRPGNWRRPFVVTLPDLHYRTMK